MAKKFINTERIEGRIYEQNLSIKTVQNQSSANYGKPFISGTLDVATDEEGLNVLSVHYTYVAEYTNSGAKNRTFAALQKIIDEGKAWITDGKDNATKVRLDTTLALNDFYNQTDELVSVKRNEGGFVTIVNELADESERNSFTVDVFLTRVTRVEADEEKNIPAPYLTLGGAVFNFRGDILPVELTIENPAGMKYFEDQDIDNSNPIFTKVWGKIVSTTVSVERTEESAFGEAAVKSYDKNVKKWLVTGAQKIPYDLGDETVLTMENVEQAMQNRAVHLAEIKKQSDEYRATKAANVDSAFASGNVMNLPGNNASAVPEAKKSTFNF